MFIFIRHREKEEMEMEPSILFYLLLSGRPFLSSSENVAYVTDVCQNGYEEEDLTLWSSSSHWETVDFQENKNFSCFLYTSGTLNCSWSFPGLQRDLRVSIDSSVCNDDETVRPLSLLSRDRVGWKSLDVNWTENFELILLFNMSLNDSWGLYSYAFNTKTLEVLSPPSNISASVNDGVLKVRWGLPRSRANSTESCYQYQLQVQDQVEPSDVGDKMFYEMPNADPSTSYHVSLRAKKKSTCFGSPQWSDWSLTTTVGQSPSLISFPVIISISVFIPMLLLGLVLCLRLQRVSDVLFPQIPDIPKEFKNFIERSDTYLDYQEEPVKTEEITTLDDVKETMTILEILKC